jgi:TonB family protein
MLIAVLLALAVLASGASAVHAQAVGTIAGKAVADFDGLPLKDVDVRLEPVDRGKKMTRKTKADGAYTFDGVLAGAYRLTAEIPGFVRHEQVIEAKADELLHLETRMIIGRLSERVTVTAERRPVPLEQRVHTQHVDVAKREATRERLLPPVTMRRVYPSFTTDDHRRGLRGEVHVVAVIDETGAVTRPRVVSTSHDELATRTVEAIQQWRYEPTRLSGVAVAVTNVSYLFVYGS